MLAHALSGSLTCEFHRPNKLAIGFSSIVGLSRQLHCHRHNVKVTRPLCNLKGDSASDHRYQPCGAVGSGTVPSLEKALQTDGQSTSDFAMGHGQVGAN